MSEALPYLLSLYVDRPHDQASRVLLIQPDPVAAFAEGLSPALPGHTFLRSLAISWASALGSYGRVEGAASFWRSPRRMRWRPLGLARRSGIAPSRTARRMVSSQRPVSRPAWLTSRSASSQAWTAPSSFLSKAVRAAAACSAPLSRSVSV